MAHLRGVQLIDIFASGATWQGDQEQMELLTTTEEDIGILPELKELIDEVIVPILLERLMAEKDLYTSEPVYYDREGAN